MKMPSDDKNPTGKDHSTPAANRALIVEFYDAFDRGDFERVRELVDPSGTWWTLTSRAGRPMWDAVARIEAVHTASRDGIRFDLGPMTAEEDRVAVVVESKADMLERGRYHNMYHNLFRIADGRISEAHMFPDTAEVERVLRGAQSGIGPIPGLLGESADPTVTDDA